MCRYIRSAQIESTVTRVVRQSFRTHARLMEQRKENQNERKVMNDKFDELAKGLAQSVTRRGAVKKFGVCLAGIALALPSVAAWESDIAACRDLATSQHRKSAWKCVCLHRQVLLACTLRPSRETKGVHLCTRMQNF